MNNGYLNKNDNGQTVVRHYLAFNLKQDIDLAKHIHLHTPIASYNLFPALDIFGLCNLSGKSGFGVDIEEQFFVKSSHSKSQGELLEVRKLAIEDDIRYILHHNLSNTTDCTALKESFAFLNLTTSSFYQKFIYETASLSELLEQQRSDLNGAQTSEKLFNTLEQESSFENTLAELREWGPDSSEKVDNFIKDTASVTATDASNLVDDILRVMSDNSNIKFERVENYYQAEMAISPSIAPNAAASEYLSYEGDEIILNSLSSIAPLGTLANSSFAWGEFIHGMAHGFLDHPCENGFYACNKKEITAHNEPLTLRTALAEGGWTSNLDPSINYNMQSFLPWDWAAIRYKYGMPAPKDVIYELNSDSALKSVFGYNLLNQALVSFPNVGHSTINAHDLKGYSIDLRYDHPSEVSNTDIKFAFVLSYDTEISKIMLNKGGSITLSDKFDTDLILSHGNYKVILHDSTSQHDNVLCIKNGEISSVYYCDVAPEYQIDVHNFDAAHHHITLNEEA